MFLKPPIIVDLTPVPVIKLSLPLPIKEQFWLVILRFPAAIVEFVPVLVKVPNLLGIMLLLPDPVL